MFPGALFASLSSGACVCWIDDVAMICLCTNGTTVVHDLDGTLWYM